MNFFIAILGLIALAASAESGGVLKIPAQAYRMPPEVMAQRQHLFKNDLPRHVANYDEIRVNPKFQQAAATSLQLNTTNYGIHYYYMYFANITIGTPAQTLTVEIDPWYDQELCVLGTGVDEKSLNTDELPPKKVYDKSQSSSYVDIGKNFSMAACGRGQNGTDVVNVGEVSTAVTFGIAQNASSYLKLLPSDGILGINPMPPFNNSQNAISQLLSGLDSPVMTWWQNETYWGFNATLPVAQLTLGAEDIDHCKSSYVYVPRVTNIKSYDRFYPVHLTTAVISEGTPEDQIDTRFEINATLNMRHNQYRIYSPRSFFYALTNATNAVYNSTVWEYVVDCDLSKHKDIVLNIGGSGFTEDETSRQIVLSPAEYIYYWSYYRVCYLSAFVSGGENGVVELPQKFLNNHCLAYNAKEDMIGFSEVKQKKLDI
ncbi:eukaryotic aspartyl protease domain-containing protein [Ditylenchus destructor]|uniref:Eukaryotic aspartyl protease domain-containing protein n=1 Tax=Ditylenchus destructor TaxID=166010 RepID=A0AAD4MFC7_9BILA|nr:eukaryotic aspartyl protease domain-containing protein [Ditylenchus destructor]